MTRLARTGNQKDLAILKFLGEKESFGYEIAENTGISSATVYQILLRLENHGLVDGWVEPYKDGVEIRSRRYYRLTEAGVVKSNKSR